jgi:hypothetical protein
MQQHETTAQQPYAEMAENVHWDGFCAPDLYVDALQE